MSATTSALAVPCPNPMCLGVVGVRCSGLGGVLHQVRIDEAARVTREASRNARSS